MKNAYGPSIVLFTFFVRLVLLPLNYQQIASSTATQALQPKVQEIREKYADKPEIANQMVALLYQETKVCVWGGGGWLGGVCFRRHCIIFYCKLNFLFNYGNLCYPMHVSYFLGCLVACSVPRCAQTNPLSGCLPALVQIPVFLALYRSFFNLASQTDQLSEPFLWLPNLEGPVFGVRSSDWLLKVSAWHDFTPPLGWHDTLCYLTIPLLLYAAQAISLRVLTPPSDDPNVQKTQVGMYVGR